MGGGALSFSGGLLIFSDFSHLTTSTILQPWPTSARSTTNMADFPLVIISQRTAEYAIITLAYYYPMSINIII